MNVAVISPGGLIFIVNLKTMSLQQWKLLKRIKDQQQLLAVVGAIKLENRLLIKKLINAKAIVMLLLEHEQNVGEHERQMTHHQHSQMTRVRSEL